MDTKRKVSIPCLDSQLVPRRGSLNMPRLAPFPTYPVHEVARLEKDTKSMIVPIPLLLTLSKNIQKVVLYESASVKGNISCPARAGEWTFKGLKSSSFGPYSEISYERQYSTNRPSEEIRLIFHSEKYAVALSGGHGLRMSSKTFPKTAYFKHWAESASEGKVEIIGSPKPGTTALLSFVGKKGGIVILGQGKIAGPSTQGQQQQIVKMCMAILKKVDLTKLKIN